MTVSLPSEKSLAPISASARLAFAVAALVCVSAVHAADSAADKQLGEMVVQSEKPAVPANLPATTEAVTAKQIAESVNSVSSSGALLYVPSVHVRERFIGDVNGGLAMRMYGVNSSAETIVYADGLLLSNFLTNSCCPGPRWGMVSPQSIDRVDVIYGPFSALYPGNSVGGVVHMTTHMPSKFEAHAQLDVFTQNFKLYGTNDRFNGVHGAATVGNKVGDWSYRVTIDRLDNHSQPTDFTAAKAKSAVAAASATTVTGAFYDKDIANNARVTTAAYNMDHTVKDDATIKIGYDFSPTVRATYTYNIWQNTSDKTVDTYLRDAAGNKIWGTKSTVDPYKRVIIDGSYYEVTAPSAGHAESDYRLHGFAVKTSSGGFWDWEANASYFNQEKDVSRSSSGNFGTTPSEAATAGSVTYGDGTGWWNIDLRGDWRPDGNLRSAHQVSFGYHADRYTTKSDKYDLAAGPWLTSAPATLNSNSRGVTATQAIYVQDAWRISPDYTLVLGGREERWQASHGSNYGSGTNVSYEDRTISAFSPKASLSHQLSNEWTLRGSYGRGVRFPTVGELFKNVAIKNVASGADATAGEIAGFPAPYNVAITNNPNLKPEKADSWEITTERALQNGGVWRTSLFGEEKHDALISQTDLTTLPGFSISSVQNVDKVRSYGVETSVQAFDALVRGLDLSGSAAYIHSRITKDIANPRLEGTEPPLIPVWRASLLAVYHASDALSYSLGYRYSGRQHHGLLNTSTGQYPDPNPNTYGGRSTFGVFDTKVLYKFDRQWSASVGIDNITNVKYYTLYPYAQRTLFASLKFNY